MKGLLLKDIMAMRKSIIFVVIIMPIIITLEVGSNIATLGFCFSMMSSAFCLEAVGKDGSSNWDTYGVILPVTRSQIIACKYFLLFINNLIFALLALVPMTLGGKTSPSDFLMVYSFFAVNLLLNGIAMIITYMVGTIHARTIQGLVVFLPYVIFMFCYSFPMNNTINHIVFPPLFLPVSLVVLAVGISLSFFLSCIIFKNKEL